MRSEGQEMRMLAPAKVNLFLRIVGRRADGYHLLDSLMAPVSLYDEIDIRVGSGPGRIVVTCDDPTIPCDETNLAHKAATLICKTTDVQADLTLSLHKRIPAGAGLGGGSSDAAAVLKGLNAGLSLGLTESALCGLAARLGADVPFFIPCRPARVSGIGEVLAAVTLPPQWLAIVVPPFGVSTPWAYRRFDELEVPPLPRIESGAGSNPLPQGERGPRTDSHLKYPKLQLVAGQWLPSKLLINDLEQAVVPEYPLIGHIKERLLHLGAEGALMSGSGSAVFGVFSTLTHAETAARALTELGKSFVVEIVPGVG